MRKGVSPIVGAMLLILIIMGVATSTTYFIRTQQERVAGRLSGAFGDQLNVVETRCVEKRLSMRIENTGDDEYDTGFAELLVIENGELNSTLSESEIVVGGEFQNPRTAGYFNYTTEGIFRSGSDFEITLSLDTGKEIKQLCRGGYRWWDRDWLYRKNIILEDITDSMDNAVIRVDIDTSDMMERGVLRQGCEDIRIVEEDFARNYTVESGCGTADTLIRFESNITEGDNRDMYVYYGNARAADRGSLAESYDFSPEHKVMKEERR